MSGALEAVTEARAAAIAPRAGGAGEAENVLTGALKSLFAVAESYPDLRASQNFLELQRELSATETAPPTPPVLQRHRPDLQQRGHTIPQSVFAASSSSGPEYFQAVGRSGGQSRSSSRGLVRTRSRRVRQDGPSALP